MVMREIRLQALALTESAEPCLRGHGLALRVLGLVPGGEKGPPGDGETLILWRYPRNEIKSMVQKPRLKRRLRVGWCHSFASGRALRTASTAFKAVSPSLNPGLSQ